MGRRDKKDVGLDEKRLGETEDSPLEEDASTEEEVGGQEGRTISAQGSLLVCHMLQLQRKRTHHEELYLNEPDGV